nr:D506 [uncultured bacterium]
MHFPTAETTTLGEVKLRLHNAEEARAVLQWIDAEDGCP